MLELMYITNNSDIAKIADDAGVDRIWIDLEIKDKEKRQKGLNTVKSKHHISDISCIKPLLKHAQMQVRINHMHEGSKEEIDKVIVAGTDYIMLPYYKTTLEVERFIKYVNGRAKTILLLETKEAVDILDETLKISGVDEIHIGLNDLHLSLKQNFMFEPVANGLVDTMCAKIKGSGKPYGFGGIARIGEGMVPAEMVLNEHYRVGSTRTILSRSFCTPQPGQSLDEISNNFRRDLAKIRAYEKMLSHQSRENLSERSVIFKQAVDTVVERIRVRKHEQQLCLYREGDKA